MGWDYGAQEEKRIDEEVVTGAAEEVDGQRREEDVDEGDG